MGKRCKIGWFGPVFSVSGYGVHNRGMLCGLLRRGWDVSVVSSDNDEGLYDDDRLLIRQHLGGEVRDWRERVWIYLVPPVGVSPRGRYNILYTTQESIDVHPHFARRCTVFDEVWVPCEFNRRSLVKAGLRRDFVRVVPEGVDSRFWVPCDYG